MKRKPKNGLIHPKVERLRMNEKFRNYTDQDLMAFHHQYRTITKGKLSLTKKQFQEMLASFNVF